MVIDTGKAEDCSDSKYVTFFQGRVFDGHINYTNLQFINDALKQYRNGNHQGLLNDNPEHQVN